MFGPQKNTLHISKFNVKNISLLWKRIVLMSKSQTNFTIHVSEKELLCLNKLKKKLIQQEDNQVFNRKNHE